MSIPKPLLKHLNRSKVPYEVVPHKTVFTAYDLATTLGAALHEVAKTLLVKADRRPVLVVLPASHRLDLGKLAKMLKAKEVRIAPEIAITKLEITPGTTPPFGSFLDLEVVVDRSLLKTPRTVLRAGSLTESIRMKVRDFLKLESPTVGSFALKGKPPPKPTKPAPKRKRPTKRGKAKRARR